MIRRVRGAVLATATLGVCVAMMFAAAPAYAGTSPALIGFDDGSAGVFETPVGAPAQERSVAPAGIYPQFSPNGTEVAYDLERSGHGGALTNSIVVADRTGAARHDVITGPTKFDGDTKSVLYPLVWSPNGREIAYGCDGQNDAPSYAPSEVLYSWEQVCVVNVTTGAHHMVTDPATDKYPPIGVGLDERWSWTPDGKHILATVDEPGPCLPNFSFPTGCGTASIGEIDVDSGATTLLTQSSLTTSTQTTPSISPNGREILFHEISNGAGAFGLWTMNAGGGNQRVFDTGGLSPAAGAIFSPNGKDVLFTAYSPADEYHAQAYEIPVGGGGKPKEMTAGNRPVDDLTWTPALTTCTVPDLKHKTLAAAKKLLKKNACSLGKVGGPKSHRSKRHVIKQSPKAKRNVPAGSKVNVTLK